MGHYDWKVNVLKHNFWRPVKLPKFSSLNRIFHNLFLLLFFLNHLSRFLTSLWEDPICGLLQKQKAAIRAPSGICEKHKDKVLRDGCSSKTILDLVTKLKTRLSFSDHDTRARDEVFPRRAVSGCGFPFESFRWYLDKYISCHILRIMLLSRSL